MQLYKLFPLVESLPNAKLTKLVFLSDQSEINYLLNT